MNQCIKTKFMGSVLPCNTRHLCGRIYSWLKHTKAQIKNTFFWYVAPENTKTSKSTLMYLCIQLTLISGHRHFSRFLPVDKGQSYVGGGIRDKNTRMCSVLCWWKSLNFCKWLRAAILLGWHIEICEKKNWPTGLIWPDKAFIWACSNILKLPGNIFELCVFCYT